MATEALEMARRPGWWVWRASRGRHVEHMGRLWAAHLDPFLNSKATWVLEPFQVMI